jgi:hypothetical protein
MRKYIIGAFIASTLLLAPAALAAQQSSGNPFDAVWSAINSLKAEVSKIKSGSGVHLYDGNGQDLGELITITGNNYLVYNTESKTLIDLTARFASDGSNNTQVFFTYNNNILYLGENCTGETYTFRDSVEGYPINSTIIGMNNTTYKITNVKEPNLTYKSFADESGCYNNGEAGTRATKVQEYTLPFSLPITWPLIVK